MQRHDKYVVIIIIIMIVKIVFGPFRHNVCLFASKNVT